jgi:hypothetical protein
VQLPAQPDHDDLVALIYKLSCGGDADRATGDEANLIHEAAYARFTSSRMP